MWVALEHAGPGALLGGLTATELYGMKNWARDDITVLVGPRAVLRPRRGGRATSAPDARWRPCGIRPSRRRAAGANRRCCCSLLTNRSTRTALGAITATVQQQLTTPANLLEWTRPLRPLRRAACDPRPARRCVGRLAVAGRDRRPADVPSVGAGDASPPEAQARPVGRLRFTDCEWDLPDGRVLVLEIDGGFHVNVENYTEDVQRHRGLTTDRRIVVRCTTYEVRHEPVGLMRDLIGAGSPPGGLIPLSWVLRWLPGQPFQHPTPLAGSEAAVVEDREGRSGRPWWRRGRHRPRAPAARHRWPRRGPRRSP